MKALLLRVFLTIGTGFIIGWCYMANVANLSKIETLQSDTTELRDSLRKWPVYSVFTLTVANMPRRDTFVIPSARKGGRIRL